MTNTRFGAETVQLSFDMDGYNVDIHVNIAGLKREIERLEHVEKQEMAKNGPQSFNLSRFARVSIDPTNEKWMELADAVMD